MHVNCKVTNISRSGCIWIFFLLTTHSFSQAPNWTFANRNGGTSQDWTIAVATDPFGNSYAAGHFYSPSISFGTFTLTNAGLTDIFLVKYDAAGNVVWTLQFGNTGSEWAGGLATDAAGNVYLSGTFNSSTLSVGTSNFSNAGWFDIFLAKLDPAGNVIWARKAGAAQNDIAGPVAVSAAGRVYMTGIFASTSLVIGATVLPNFGWNDIFLASFDASTGNPLWARRIGDHFEEYAMALDADAAGNVYLAGTFSSIDITVGSTVLTNSGSCIDDLFIAKFDISGNAVWARSAFGWDRDYVTGIASDNTGNVYITGYFYSTSITFGSITVSSTNGNSLYLAKYNSAGNALWVYAPAPGMGKALTIDACGDIYITGDYCCIPITFGTTTLPSTGTDIYIAKVSPAGAPLWATRAGSPNPVGANAIDVSPATNYVWTAGYYNGPSGMTFGSTALSSTGTDGFVSALDPTCFIVPLPVELISFSGERISNVNLLRWTTAAEINNDFFSIERRNREGEFESIGIIDGAGNSTRTLNYSFADEGPLENVNYYRLRQTDFNGDQILSHTIAVSGKANPLYIYFNPENSALSVYESAPGTEVEITSALGVRIFKAENETIFDLSALAPGIYFVSVIAGNSIQTRKIFKP